MRVNERRVCEGVMPLRPVVGFLRPRSRSRRTCSTRSECWPRNASIPCRTGSRWTPSRLNSRSAKLSWESRVRLISGSGLAVALRPKQLVVEFTDALQGGLEFLVIAQALLDEGLLFFGEADLLVAAAGIADGQHPDEMALTAREPRRISVVEGRAAASLARVRMSVSCFIYNDETLKRCSCQSLPQHLFQICRSEERRAG